jgi:hypothetical protein
MHHHPSIIERGSLIMKIFILFCLVILTACSQRQIYDSVQTNNRNECERLSGVQRKECLERLAPDYQTYERQRKELLEAQ